MELSKQATKVKHNPIFTTRQATALFTLLIIKPPPLDDRSKHQVPVPRHPHRGRREEMAATKHAKASDVPLYGLLARSIPIALLGLTSAQSQPKFARYLTQNYQDGPRIMDCNACPRQAREAQDHSRHHMSLDISNVIASRIGFVVDYIYICTS